MKYKIILEPILKSARDPQLSNPDAARLLERTGSFNFGTVSNWVTYFDIKIGLKKELTKMYFDILFISDFVQQVTSHKKLFVFATPETEDLVVYELHTYGVFN